MGSDLCASVVIMEIMENAIEQAADAAPPRGARSPKPTHYKVVCISMYTRDIEELENKVSELKRRGWTKVSKSLLIRIALSRIDAATMQIPRP